MKLVFSAIAFLSLLSAQANVIIYKQNILVTDRQDGYAPTERFTGWTVIDLQTGQIGLVKAFGNWVSVEQPEAETAALLGQRDRAKPLGIISIKDGEFSGLTARGVNQSLSVGLSTNWTIPRTLAVNGSHLIYTNYSFPLVQPIQTPIRLPPIPVRTNPPGGAIIIGLNSQTISGRTEINSLSRARSDNSPDEVATPNSIAISPFGPIPTNNFSLNRSVERRLLREFRGALIFDRENTVQANIDHLDHAATVLQFKQILLNKGYFDWDNRAILTGAPIGTHPPPLPPLPQ